MIRYTFYEGNGEYPGDMEPEEDGDYVEYCEAQAEITRFTAELSEARAEIERLKKTIEVLLSEIGGSLNRNTS